MDGGGSSSGGEAKKGHISRCLARKMNNRTEATLLQSHRQESCRSFHSLLFLAAALASFFYNILALHTTVFGLTEFNHIRYTYLPTYLWKCYGHHFIVRLPFFFIFLIVRYVHCAFFDILKVNFDEKNKVVPEQVVQVIYLC